MDRKLFVANVSWNISEDDLYNLFAAQGPVETMKMPMNRMTGRHKGYAFVEMVNDDDAMKAVNELNGMMLDNRPLAVNFQDENRLRRHQENLYAASPNPKLFIRNLSPTATEEHLVELFSQVGSVVSVKIPVDHYTGEPRTYGFAEMATTEDAQAVVERFNDTMLEGDELQILFADPNRIKANQFKKFQQQQYPQQRGGYPPRGGGYYPYPPPGYYPYPPHPGGHPGQYPGYPPPPPHYQGGGYGPPPPYQQAGYAKPGKPGYHPAHDPYGDD